MNRHRTGSAIVTAAPAVGVGTLLGFILAVRPLPATAAMYTNDTDWAGANWTLVNGDVIAGVHTNINQFSVPAGVTNSVYPYTNGAAFGRAIIFAQSASIAGVLRANAAGYPATNGPGAGSSKGGAGYGGRGGSGQAGTFGMEYGDANNPTNLGSGGGSNGSGGVGGAGGGALILDISGTATVNGTLSANGGAGTAYSGGGSGGSILLKAAAIQGAGTISADGGAGADPVNNSGGGAGGRIAFDTPANSFAGIIRAFGQAGAFNSARNGTFNFVSGPGTDLIIKGPIALPPGTNWTFRNLLVTNGARFEIQSATNIASRIRFLGDVTIGTGTVLSADGWGYMNGQGPGAGSVRSGAGYGGRGGSGITGTRGLEYGDANNPTNLGSGGGSYTGTGGGGGGALILAIDGTATVNGTVSANGAKGATTCGGGSGGSILIKAAAIHGEGTISADGGSGGGTGIEGGGAGGRIAFDTPTSSFAGTIRASGQPGARNNSQNGTFSFASGPGTDLIIKGPIALPPGTNWTFRNLLVTNGARFEIQSATNIASRIRFLGDVTIGTGTVLSADGWGHPTGQGLGAGTARSGAGYGGSGGKGANGTPGGVYGAANNPTNLGSGGGTHSGAGGSGGGALILEIDGAATVNGTVSANGAGGTDDAGGGSGGSLLIKARTVQGTGTIRADGGSAGSNGGGGGGGRVLIFTGAFADAALRPQAIQDLAAPPETFTGTITVTGQVGSVTNAENGTKAFRYLPRPGGGTVITIR